MAGLIRQIIADGSLDREFIDAETQGYDSLEQAVAPFTPDMVATSAGIDAGELIEAAHILGRANKGAAATGTGANMSGHPSTVVYLAKVLSSLRGWWRRAGDEIANPGVFINPFPPIAASTGPMPVKDVGEEMQARGVKASLAGIPVSAVPDEILSDGPGKIRAMIVAGANPVLAWPDQDKVVEAFEDLDLLVCIEPFMGPTAEMADYVLAPKLALECETNSAANEKWALGGPGWGYAIPYGQVEPPVVEPPQGSDLREDWEFIYDLAQAMGVELALPSMATFDPQQAEALGTKLDMSNKPSTEEIWALAQNGAPVPYGELRQTRGPQVLAKAPLTVQPRPEGMEARLELAAQLALDDLAAIAADRRMADSRYPFRLLSRRLNDVNNSCSHDNPRQLRKWQTNPAFIHPADLARIGVAAGELVAIESAKDRIVGVAEADDSLREGCIAMPHSWGRHPRREQRPRIDGANTGRLVSIERDLDPVTGQPLMSGIPVRISSAA